MVRGAGKKNYNKILGVGIQPCVEGIHYHFYSFCRSCWKRIRLERIQMTHSKRHHILFLFCHTPLTIFYLVKNCLLCQRNLDQILFHMLLSQGKATLIDQRQSVLGCKTKSSHQHVPFPKISLSLEALILKPCQMIYYREILKDSSFQHAWENNRLQQWIGE